MLGLVLGCVVCTAGTCAHLAYRRPFTFLWGYKHMRLTTRYFYVDINECEDGFSGGCGQICNNTIGSFECSCNTGFELGSDGFLCLGEENKSYWERDVF